jgi:amino acid transporter/GNAT superfamily N-acetyltransferase
MARPEAAGFDIVSRGLAQNRLGVPSVVFFGVAGAAPLTVILGAVTTIYAVVGSTVVPVSYLVAAGILMVFTVGFVAMSRHIVNSGAFYSYISRGLGRVPGIGAAFIALPAYAMMQIGLFGLFGVVASGLLEANGITVSWFPCALVAWALVAILGLLWVDLSGRVLAVLLIAEITIVLVYDAVMIANPADGAVSFATLSPAQALSPEFGALLVVAIAGFVGFEATVVLSEEAKDPRRTISRATHWAVLLPGLLCALSAWAMSVSTGPGRIVESARAQQTDLVFALVTPHVPAVLVSVGYVLFLTSVFAALLAFHAAVARYQFALGREGVLPGVWGRTNPRTGAPTLGSLTQSTLALAVLVTYAVVGLDPLVYLFAWLTTVGGLGVLILMWGASAAVVVFFFRNRSLENVWRARLAPCVAFLLLSGVLAATAIGLGDLLQVSSDSPFQWLFPTAYAACALLGCGWALLVRVRRPEVYAAIGRGADGRVTAPADPSAVALSAHPAPDPTPLSGPPPASTEQSAPTEWPAPTEPAAAEQPAPAEPAMVSYAIRDVVTRDVAPVNTTEIKALLTGTIGHGAVARWITPEPVARWETGPAYFEIFVEHAVQYGEIYTASDPASGNLVAVALWFPCTSPIPAPRDFDLRLKDACGSGYDRAREVDAVLEAHHPTEPHHYLAFIAVRPDRQNLGIGSALLARHHARIDAVGIPAYLEANDLRNRDLYLRHGYTSKAVIRLPDGGPPIWPMWRPPVASRRNGFARAQAAGNS